MLRKNHANTFRISTIRSRQAAFERDLAIAANDGRSTRRAPWLQAISLHDILTGTNAE